MPASRPSSSRLKRLGYSGTELQGAINDDPKALARFETIRAHGAARMGLIKDVSQAAKRQHTPKVAFVAPPKSYTASSGKAVAADDIDLLVRAMSMGKLHHAMMGTAAVAIGTAAGHSRYPGQPGRRRWRTPGGPFRPPIGHVACRRRGGPARRSVGGQKGGYEPQRSHFNGRLGAHSRRVSIVG